MADCVEGRKASFFGFSTVDLSDPAPTEALRDRLVGVAMMAEALSTNHPVGRYRELLRLFEYAFAMTLSQAEKKLAQFLEGADLGYTRAEVKEWLEKRHGSIHGDQKKTSELVMEADVRHFLARMEQAAHDVLLNKVVWHSPSTERRTVLPHYVATTDREGKDFRLTRGRDAKLVTQVMDPFGSYPVDMGGIITSPPSEWWCPLVESRVAQGQVAVRDP